MLRRAARWGMKAPVTLQGPEGFSLRYLTFRRPLPFPFLSFPLPSFLLCVMVTIKLKSSCMLNISSTAELHPVLSNVFVQISNR